jgi:riboflavin biosynthesis pyrimidine reductase
MWTTKTGEPVGVVHSFISIDGKLWMTTAEQRKQITALRRDPRSCVCISRAGTALDDDKSITHKGRAIIHVANDCALKK